MEIARTVKLLKNTARPWTGRDGCHWQEDLQHQAMARSLYLIGREQFSRWGRNGPCGANFSDSLFNLTRSVFPLADLPEPALELPEHRILSVQVP